MLSPCAESNLLPLAVGNKIKFLLLWGIKSSEIQQGEGTGKRWYIEEETIKTPERPAGRDQHNICFFFQTRPGRNYGTYNSSI